MFQRHLIHVVLIIPCIFVLFSPANSCGQSRELIELLKKNYDPSVMGSSLPFYEVNNKKKEDKGARALERKNIQIEQSDDSENLDAAKPQLSRIETIYSKYYEDNSAQLKETDPRLEALQGDSQVRRQDPRIRYMKKKELENSRDEDLFLRDQKDIWKRFGRNERTTDDETVENLDYALKWREMYSEQAGQNKTIETTSFEKDDLIESLVRESKEPEEDYLFQFGYDFFQVEKGVDVDQVILENLAVPGDDYIIGPGDELLIRAWGADVDLEEQVSVSNEGTISISRIGVIPVAGLKSSEIEKAVNEEAQKYIPGINLRVSLDNLKTLEIYFAGNISQPGLHVLPAFSTIVTGLIKAGGPTKDGSLRTVRLIRNKQVVSELDIYDVLLHGNREDDFYLQSGDMIFIPDIGPTVAVDGLVKKRGIFELKGEKNWPQILSLAGGLLPQANEGSLIFKRFADDKVYLKKKLNLNTLTPSERDFPINDGDYLFAMLPELEEVIKLSGHVFYPGLIAYTDGMTLQDVVTAEMIKPGAIVTEALIKRLNPTTGFFSVIHFPLQGVLLGDYNAPLEPYDELIILDKDTYDIQEEVYISGAVWKPGKYPFSPGMKLSSLFAMAGGLKKSALLTEIELNRQGIVDNKAITIRQTINWQTLLNEERDLVLEEKDFVVVKAVNGFGEIKLVQLMGEVDYPGTYAIQENDTVTSLLLRAGGYTEDAYLYGASLERVSAKRIKEKNYQRLLEELERELGRANAMLAKEGSISTGPVLQAQQTLLKNLKEKKIDGRVVVQLASISSLKHTKYDFKLRDGDKLSIPSKPDFISILGNVYSANAYFYDSDMKISDYLEKAGGVTPSADRSRMYVIKANGEVVSKKSNKGAFLFSSFEQMKLMPGDTLVVPEDFERVPWFRMVRDMTDILFKLSTTYGVVVSISDNN